MRPRPAQETHDSSARSLCPSERAVPSSDFQHSLPGAAVGFSLVLAAAGQVELLEAGYAGEGVETNLRRIATGLQPSGKVRAARERKGKKSSGRANADRSKTGGASSEQ